MRISLLFLLTLSLFSCKDKENKPSKTPSEVNQIASDSTKDFTEFKVLDSKVLNNEVIWNAFAKALTDFSTADYDRVKPLVFEKNIPEIQQAIIDGKLSHEELVLFYLTRIRKYDRENALFLNSVIAINPTVLAEAKEIDLKGRKDIDPYSTYGMPILLKDNINAVGMPTTAGAVAFENNNADDSFIVKRLKEKGALILGKANLSEWAYFFCGDCPSGYSAVGGQTLNPYGRKRLDTGGSSSGSGVAMAANFAVAAIGTETSGSILSPASANSVVGLKPTVGLLSRSGIVPISSTLDTPGPMTRSVIDNAILLNALTGMDKEDPASEKLMAKTLDYVSGIKNIKSPESFLKGKRLGYYGSYMKEDTLYADAVNQLKNAGATLIELEEPKIDLPNFTRLLNLDMQKDLPNYIAKKVDATLKIKDVSAIIAFNKKDSAVRMPYGQKLFYGIINDSATAEEFAQIKDTLQRNGREFFDAAIQKNKLDAVLSINNYMGGYAAVAKYPALTVPMGYTKENRPMGLTFIAPTLSEAELLELGYAFEQISKMRKTPEGYN